MQTRTTRTRNKRGRPAKPDGQARTLTLPSIRVNVNEMSFIETQAATAGLSVSEYVRGTAIRRKIAPQKSAVDDRLLLELNRCGVNLNQIAKGVNRGQGLPRDMAEAIAELRGVMARIAGAS